MAAPKRPTHIVTHRNLYYRVDGKIQHVPAGTSMAFNARQAKAMGARIKPIDSEVVDVSSADVNTDPD